MKKQMPIILTGAIVLGVSACSPPILLPPVQEPLDSVAWQNCANDAKARSGRSMVDAMTMDSNRLLCEGVALSNDPKRGDEAVEMLTEAAIIDKKDYRPYWLSGRVLTAAGRYEEALTHFSRAKKRAPQMEVPTVKLAKLVAEKSGDEEALRFLENARQRGMCEFSCTGMIAELYHKTGKRDEAKAIYEKMMEKKPDDPEAYIGMARLCNLDEDFKKEADYLRQAIKTKGYDALDKNRKADLHYSEAFALYNAGKYTTARKRIDKAMNLDDEFPAEWLLLAGWIELKLNEPAMAMVKFEKAIDKDKKLAAARAGAGDAAKALGNAEEAERYYKKAAFLDPTNGVFKLKLAAAYLDLKDYDKAKIQLKDAEKLGEDKLPQDLLGEVRSVLDNR